MNISLKPSAYSADLEIPSSKSYMQRAIALAMLSDGVSELQNPDTSNDSLAALGIARAMGSSIQEQPGKVLIGPASQASGITVSVGEAGLGLRLFAPVCALLGHDIRIEGRGSLLSRPMGFMEATMRGLGAEISLAGGQYAPIHIHSRLKGGIVEMDGSQSSQLLTGLLVALPLAERDSVLRVSSLKSLPYVQMTIDIIKRFGGEILNDDFKVFSIKGRQRYTACKYEVEGDWSSAAAHIVAAATSGRAIVRGLNINSLQADKAVLDVVSSCGAYVDMGTDYLYVAKSELRPFDFDATNCPDLFPVLAALASCCGGRSRIKGVSRLAHKESNRALSIKEEFGKIGISVEINDDVMSICGGKARGAIVSSRNDHRMAMSLAVCALNADSPIELDGAECVAKSYPRFWDHYMASARQPAISKTRNS